MLVNGASWPTAAVQARRYRLRLLNACNARFLNLQLYVADSSGDGITLDLTGTPDTNPKFGTPKNKPFVNAATGKPAWLQIGTEGGFLATPALVPSNIPLVAPPADAGGSVDPSKVKKSLLVAPAERPDVIVDFKGYNGKSIILYNDAPAPFPGGDVATDYFPGLNTADNPANAHADDVGPNTRVLMRFDVIEASGPSDKKLFLGDWSPLFLGLDPFLLPPFIHQVPSFFKKRFLTLNEVSDEFGRLIQILGNAAAPFGSPYFGTAAYGDYGVPPGGPSGSVGATEEHVNEGDVEVWEIYNTTGDVHPMHFHLVNVQVVNRQLFSGPANDPVLCGPIIPADENETGWKETVQMYPGTVTRCIMKFDLPSIVDRFGNPINTKAIPHYQLPIKNGQPPTSPRTVGGHEYVWHCHILEHEEHDMMHALVVKPKNKW
jgi:spore coat protein A